MEEHGVANNAVDGNSESVYFKYSCTHTAHPYSNSPWWRVDVGNVVSFDQLDINRRSHVIQTFLQILINNS